MSSLSKSELSKAFGRGEGVEAYAAILERSPESTDHLPMEVFVYGAVWEAMRATGKTKQDINPRQAQFALQSTIDESTIAGTTGLEDYETV